MELRGRPAHIPGPTFLTYTPNGRHLITAGANNSIRIFEHSGDDEPLSIDNCSEGHTSICSADSFFVAGSEDGTVSKYSLQSRQFEEILVRSSLPIRGLSISPDGEWVAVVSDELVVKLVNTKDMSQVILLRDQSRGNKSATFDRTGTHVAIASTDGTVYIYSFSSKEPRLLKKVTEVIPRVDSESAQSITPAWHPSGEAIAVPSPINEVRLIDPQDGWRVREDKIFRNGHVGYITALAWSPLGGILATAGADKRIVLWKTSDLSIITTYNDLPEPAISLSWHNSDNTLSYTTEEGEVFIRAGIVPTASASLLHDKSTPWKVGSSQPATLARASRARAGTPDSIDELLGDDIPPNNDDFMMVDDEDGLFVEDDDGAGYVAPDSGTAAKRRRLAENNVDYSRGYGSGKSIVSTIHPSFQPGSTPWKGDRRYLCLNLLGAVWTINQQTHHTVTVEFYDREFQRDFHFTDPFLWDKACLGQSGTLFSCPAVLPKSKKNRDEDAEDGSHPSMIYYRPHECWTTRADWRTSLPPGENVTSIGLSDSCVVVTTTQGYVRVYSLFGVPLKVYRQKSIPAVASAAWEDYILTVGNGPSIANGEDGFISQLLYSIENIKTNEICQSDDIVALPPGGSLKSVMFSDVGDPYIFDSEGVLLVLEHWRTPGHARWAPVLDTNMLPSSGPGSDRRYWPVAVAQNKFYCIILKGNNVQHPFFPRPLLSDFALQIPISTRGAGVARSKDEEENERLEQSFVQNSLALSLQQDRMSTSSAPSREHVIEQKQLAVEADKAILQLLALECRLGDDRGMKALELVTLFRDDSGRMLDAASKVAMRFKRNLLADKIRQMAEDQLEEKSRMEML